MHTHRSGHRISPNEIKQLVEKHQYFKNPSSHAIRLTAIMKYLKKKGMDLSFNNADLYVDKVVQSMSGVKKVEYYKYYKEKK